ncbi:MAG: bifunctional phosphoribosylaminoimidazolecarboxamide formyltransferase/IMP cyclohydrolase [Armatimonadetes bacterium]|nr:bifunctional phosphoribosylaminoimidazolecarboxamide formyltransferase/IMP cyclohydrolase [Armatimonadota bacterium]
MAIKRALLSVSDKTGLPELARGLYGMGVEMISTGGTARALEEGGVPVMQVAQVTGFPEMLDGRVKTLHPNIHGGLLAVRSDEAHMASLGEHGILPIDLVIVNLYPFAETVARPGVTFAEAVENIDIGGPSMIRSAAKNHAFVAVVVDPADYPAVLEEMKAGEGELSEATRRRLAAKAFSLTAAYDRRIAAYLAGRLGEGAGLPERIELSLPKARDLRYGENPHQKAAFYREEQIALPCVATARQLHGKEISFNNINDLDAAFSLVKEFEEPACAIIKHTNPCGCACGDPLAEAYRRALEADPISAYGGIIAFNKEVDAETASAIGSGGFVEAIIAPAYAAGALEALTTRKKWAVNLMVLETGSPEKVVLKDPDRLDFKKVEGGLLVQEADHKETTAANLKAVSRRPPTEQEIADLLFAWKVVKHVKSNAIVIARNRQLLGVGAGQMNRAQPVELAVRQAGEKARGAVLASDAFFPFADGPETAARAGVTAIIQPGGSKKDEDSIAVADRHDMAMVFTGVRHFKH